MSDLDTRIDRIDDLISGCRQLELKAVWANHTDEVEYYVVEIQRLQQLRDLVQRGPFTATETTT